MLGNFPCFWCRLLTFFKINCCKKFFHEHYQNVKQFESRSEMTFCSSRSESKLFVKVISRQQKSLLAGKELKNVFGPSIKILVPIIYSYNYYLNLYAYT